MRFLKYWYNVIMCKVHFLQIYRKCLENLAFQNINQFKVDITYSRERLSAFRVTSEHSSCIIVLTLALEFSITNLMAFLLYRKLLLIILNYVVILLRLTRCLKIEYCKILLNKVLNWILFKQRYNSSKTYTLNRILSRTKL